MQSLSVYARLFARAIGGSEAENILLHGLLRLSSASASTATTSTTNRTQSSTRLAITRPSSAIRRAVHLVTASSGFAGRDHKKIESMRRTQRTDSLVEQRQNVYGDDAFFVTTHRLGDFLGRPSISHAMDTSHRLASGVADGVGSWREHGIDPALFSSSLMSTCKSLIDNKLIDLNPLTLKELLSKGYKELLENKQCIIGE